MSQPPDDDQGGSQLVDDPPEPVALERNDGIRSLSVPQVEEMDVDPIDSVEASSEVVPEQPAQVLSNQLSSIFASTHTR
jgi:hypothetical protein